MKLNTKVNGTEVIIAMEGRLDTTTSPALDAEINGVIDGTALLVLDMEELEYLSSSGLRVILSAQKKMTKQGEFIIKNVNEIIMEIFETTGFSDILTIE
ncbi:MAG: STAS domain-containing protein [Eubacteriales bacterium]